MSDFPWQHLPGAFGATFLKCAAILVLLAIGGAVIRAFHKDGNG